MNGFVMLIMLVYMQILSLLAMQGFSAVIHEKKLFHHRMIADDQRQLMMTILTQYVDRFSAPICIVHVRAGMDISKLESSWWQRNGCHYPQDNQYIFIREKLDEDPCAVMTNEYNQKVIPVYYRNTLLHLSGVSAARELMLQDTIAVPGRSKPTCNGVPRTIKSGRQMLRWL